VQPFPMRYGSGMIREGKLVFSNIRQHTTIKRSSSSSGTQLPPTGSKPSAQGGTP
jgi:hypothetical protein